MSGFNDDRKKHGYSQEDQYFHKENQRLIAELRKKKADGKGAPGGADVINAQDRFANRGAKKSKGGSGGGHKKAA